MKFTLFHQILASLTSSFLHDGLKNISVEKKFHETSLEDNSPEYFSGISNSNSKLRRNSGKFHDFQIT